MRQEMRRESKVVIIDNNNTAGIYQSRLFVEHGETATPTSAEHKTLKGAERWAKKILWRKND